MCLVIVTCLLFLIPNVSMTFTIASTDLFYKEKHLKQYADKFIIIPYYNLKNSLYPFSNVYGGRPSTSYQRNRMAWNHCQFHEDCGEGNCCYVHFRFRSLPKSFCRPNRNINSELCEPLTKYRSSEGLSAWKQQINEGTEKK